MKKTKILGTGSYLPKKVLTNEDLSKLVDTTDEWIVSRTGIRERRVVETGETCSHLAHQASLAALKMANVSVEEIDIIIFATLSADQRLPGASYLLQDKLKAKHASAFDINAACSGFVFALSIGDQFIKTGFAKKILVIGAEVLSRVLDWNDRSTCILFGDGAGAVVLGTTEAQEHAVLSTHLFSNGSLHHLLEIPGGGTANEWTAESFARKEHFVKMTGKEVFKEAVESMTMASRIALEKGGLTIEDVDLFIPHQANERIIHAVAKKLKCPEKNIFLNLNKYGNTSAASIPIALDEAVRQERIKKGDLVLLASFGAGFSWGSSLLQW